MDIVKKLSSGTELILKPAPFKDAHALFKTIAKELEGVTVNLSGESAKIDLIKNVVLRLLSSENVEDRIWPCMQRSLYRGSKITPEVFESMENRKDFLEVAQEVLMFTIEPFIGDLGSKLNLLVASGSKSTDIQK